MADLLLVRRRGKTVISAESVKGTNWIRKNTYAKNDTIFIEQDEELDFIKLLIEDDITYEER